MLLWAMAKPDFYQILGIPPKADIHEIKAAYRSAAKILHPDRGGDAEAFRLLKLAHDVLTNPLRRAAYDATGDFTETTASGAEDPALTAAVGELFLEVIQKVKNPQNEDVVILMRAAANDHIQHLSMQINAVRELTDKIELAISQIQAVAGQNKLKEIAVTRRDDLAVQLDRLVSNKNLYAGVLHFLDGYVFEVKNYFKYVSIDP